MCLVLGKELGFSKEKTRPFLRAAISGSAKKEQKKFQKNPAFLVAQKNMSNCPFKNVLFFFFGAAGKKKAGGQRRF
jgi:hypothetical protein